MELFHILVYTLIAICSLFFFFLRKHYSYWADRDVIHDPPALFYGNMKEFRRSKPLREPFREFYMKHRDAAPFAGFYLFLRPAVILFDLDLVKNVLIKDFNSFAHRGNYYNEREDPLTAHLFNLDGPKWRAMRAKLTPTFTSGKMKFMFPTIVQVAEKFVNVFNELLVTEQVAPEQQVSDVDAVGIEVKELLARFTTDVIGTCAFGLDCNSLCDPHTQFRLMGKKAFSERRHGPWLFAFMQAFPNLARKLRLKAVPQDVSDFFMGVVRETVEYREREGIKRNDFMNLLIEMKNNNEMEGLTLDEIAAQAFVFFLAGFETSSSTMSFCLYELAINQHIQDKARDEINEMLERHEGKFTYEGIRELKYLQQILYETMRMYSIASVVVRKTVNDYKVPNSKVTLEKGTLVIVPVDAIHRDPKIYPNPEVFDPERFTPSEIEKRHHMTWLPFGEGPRNCIGLRFGEMQAIVGLATLLKHFKFTTSPETQIPIEIDLNAFILSAKGGIVLNVEKV